jgi:excisionase family DNA binding protein
MTTTLPTRTPVVASADERPALTALENVLADQAQGRLTLVHARGESIELPETVLHLLRQVVVGLADDQPVAVVTLPRELTIQRAADLLDVPATHVVHLLDQGEIAATAMGARRRIRFEDLMAYKARRDAERRAALDEMVRLSEEMGLYALEAEGKLGWREQADPSR